MSPNQDETAVHGKYSAGDLTVLVRPGFGRTQDHNDSFKALLPVRALFLVSTHKMCFE